MACVTNYCNGCGHTWWGVAKPCPRCQSEDFITEFDEWQDHEEAGE